MISVVCYRYVPRDKSRLLGLIIGLKLVNVNYLNKSKIKESIINLLKNGGDFVNEDGAKIIVDLSSDIAARLISGIIGGKSAEIILEEVIDLNKTTIVL